MASPLDALDLDANYYVKHSSLQNSLAKTILSKHSLSPHAHILDVGCGDGRITAELACLAKLGKVIGLDPSPSMIKFASENFTKAEFPNLDFQLAKAEDVTFFEQFDLIVSFSCFHWIKNPKKALRQLSASLKPGGKMLILTYPKESPYYRYLDNALKNYPEYSHLSATHTALSSTEYHSTLCQNRLQILSFEQQNLNAFYNNSQEFKEYIRGWLNSYVCLPECQRDAFLEAVSDAVVRDRSLCKDGKISVPYITLVIEACKLL